MKLLDCAWETVSVALVTICETDTTVLKLPEVTVGNWEGEGVTPISTVGAKTVCLVGCNEEGAKVGAGVGALEGSSIKGACTVAPGMVVARLVDTALTVAGFDNKASIDDVLPADAAVTTLYATCTPTTVACASSLLLDVDVVTVPSDQKSCTEVMVTVLPVGNTDMIDAVKAV